MLPDQGDQQGNNQADQKDENGDCHYYIILLLIFGQLVVIDVERPYEYDYDGKGDMTAS